MKKFMLICLITFMLISCHQEEVMTVEGNLKKELDGTAVPIGSNPNHWTDAELRALDALANKKIVGLGEATHGTADFFEAKYRIFRYLAEKHNYRVFAIEADFGESIYLNEVIWAGKTSEVEKVMKEKMIFWTWRTEEVKNFLMWMSDYNKGKSDYQKISYMGVDCQYNQHNIVLLSNYLQKANNELFTASKPIFDEISEAQKNFYRGYDTTKFSEWLATIDKLQKQMSEKQFDLILQSSPKEYELNTRLLTVIRQVICVRSPSNSDSRDKYMADNALWLSQYFDGRKMAIWAHNAHIEFNPNYGGVGIGAMGFYLKKQLGDLYTTIAFAFSQGEFTAVGKNNMLGTQKIEDEPVTSSVNDYFSQTNGKNFFVDIKKLIANTTWNKFFIVDRLYLSIGAVFNGNSKQYYRTIGQNSFDYFIYFEKTSATKLLR